MKKRKEMKDNKRNIIKFKRTTEMTGVSKGGVGFSELKSHF